MKNTLLVFGTRPELIKILPIIHEYKRRGIRKKLIVAHTGQHDKLIKEDLTAFKVVPDYSMSLPRQSGSLNELIAKMLLCLSQLLADITASGEQVHQLMAQGDTASVYCAALTAFHFKIPFFHIEGGLRTYDLKHPFPEEFYRQSISKIAALHFVPTAKERTYLLKEKIAASKIKLSGNTVIDNLARYYPEARPQVPKNVLITLHRRTFQSTEKDAYVRYFEQLALKNPHWSIKWLLHPSTKIEHAVFDRLENVSFLRPVSYFKMLELYSQTAIIYTDSGGVQEEAAYLGIPCVIARTKTERGHAIENGLARLLEPQNLNINSQIAAFSPEKLIFKNPLYGSGKSAKLIVDVCTNS